MSGAPRARVLVTRARNDAAALVAELEAAGFHAVVVPLVERHQRLAELREVSGHFDWLFLTSRGAVDAWVAAGRPGEIGAVACVGPATRERAEAAGLTVDVVPDAATGAALAHAVPLAGRTILYPRASAVTPGAIDRLLDAGASVTDVVVYDNREPAGTAAALAAAWPVDLVTLFSGSAARRYAQAAASLPGSPPIVVIGPSTAAAAREVGLKVNAVAEPHTTAGVVAASLALWSRTVRSDPPSG